MSKRGRPKSSEPIRKLQYRLRITPEEHKFLKEVSEYSGLSMSELIRAGVLDYRENTLKQNLFRREDKLETYNRIKEVLSRDSNKNHDDSDKNDTDAD